MKFMNKKGVSPIIAAVLLVVITIAIGATTMAFIRSLSDSNLASATEKADMISCGTDVEFEVVAIDNSYKICKNTTGNYLDLTLKNKGSKDIKYFRLTALGDNISSIVDVDKTGIETNQYGNINLSYSASNPSEFIIEPIIQGQPGKDVICTDSGIKWSIDNLNECN